MQLFYRVLHTWQELSAFTQSPEKAVDLLQVFHADNNRLHYRPGPRAYAMVFETLTRATDSVWALTTADQLFRQLQSLGSAPALRDDTVVAQNSYLHLLAVLPNGDPAHAERVLLETMAAPDAKSYAAVLRAWGHHGRPDRASLLLERALRVGGANQVCFNLCLQALGRAGFGQRAEDLLWRMHCLYREGNEQVRPDAYSYLAAINAWAKGGHPERATAVLEQMLQPHGSVVVLPTTAIYTAVLDAWARRPDSGPRVEALLHRMEDLFAQQHSSGAARPGRRAYTIAIGAWGASTRSALDAPDRATEILRLMQARSQAPGRADLVPNTIAYTALIHAWARSPRSEAPQRALTILRHMETVYRDTGQMLAAPDTITYNAVLSAFARHGKAEDAQRLLEEMTARIARGAVGVWPDAISWATVMHAVRKRRRADSAAVVHALLRDLENLYVTTRHPTLKPTPRVYAAVILAHARNADGAEVVLWRMLELYQQSSVPDADSTGTTAIVRDAPDTFVCNALLRVWAHSDDPVAPQRAEAILRWMIDQVRCENSPHLQPDRASFGYVLQAWRQSQRRNAGDQIYRIRAEMELNYPQLLACGDVSVHTSFKQNHHSAGGPL